MRTETKKTRRETETTGTQTLNAPCTLSSWCEYQKKRILQLLRPEFLRIPTHLNFQ